MTNVFAVSSRWHTSDLTKIYEFNDFEILFIVVIATWIFWKNNTTAVIIFKQIWLKNYLKSDYSHKKKCIQALTSYSGKKIEKEMFPCDIKISRSHVPKPIAEDFLVCKQTATANIFKVKILRKWVLICNYQ